MSTRYSGYTAMVADGRASATREQEVRRQKPSQSTRPGPARSTVERNWVPSRPCCTARTFWHKWSKQRILTNKGHLTALSLRERRGVFKMNAIGEYEIYCMKK